MKSLFVLFSVFLVSSTYAASNTSLYINEVEKKLNSLFSDTVNEGGTRAEVERVKRKPKIKCGNIVRSGSKAIIFCTAHIKTTFYSGGKKQRGSTICTSLSYVIKNNKVAERYREEAFNMCLENIYDASQN